MKNFSVLSFLLSILFISFVCINGEKIKQLLMKLNGDQDNNWSMTSHRIKTLFDNKSNLVFVNNEIIYEDVMHKLIHYIGNVKSTYFINKLLMRNLNALEKEMIIYKAMQEKYVITVFTNIICDYCHKLHEQIKDYNKLGITVRYLAFSHPNMQEQTGQDMKSIWCAEDRNKALGNAMNGKGIQPRLCSINIANHYKLGIRLGITGTPSIVLSNGYVILGYRSPQEMKAFLENREINE